MRDMMRYYFQTTLWPGLLVLSLATAVAAKEDDDNEFAFNLFSDVAPILALFGEQFARQFMSESLTWLDHVIFAMVPLGIVAAVTGAIRVQGPHIAKAFIGRARENRALVEFDLMSSTSHEVGEAFNGKGIVRVMGQTSIAEFLIFPNEYDASEAFYKEFDVDMACPEDDETRAFCGIHSLSSVVQPDDQNQQLMNCHYYHDHHYKLLQSWFKLLQRHVISLFRISNSDLEQGRSTESNEPAVKYINGLGPLNMQLNYSSDHIQRYRYAQRIELVAVGIIAFMIQAGLLVLASATVVYHPLRDSIGFDTKPYGLPCYFAGTVLLSLGVGICSYAVERNTIELSWTVSNKSQRTEARIETQEDLGSKPKRTETQDDLSQYPRLLFLQKRQVVNDQSFDAYAMLAGPKRQIIASTRNKAWVRNQDKRENSETGHDHLWKLITVCASATAGVGFTAQFMGLRGLTYPCSIAQILAIIVMTLLRASIRRRLGREPANCEALAG